MLCVEPVARFKIFWTVAALSVFGFLMTSLLANSDSPILQNNSINSIKSDWSENIEDKFMDAYNATLKEYGSNKADILDPCKMRESFGNVGLSKCGTSSETDD